MGWPEVAEKWPEKWKTSCDSRWPPPPFADLIPARPVAIGHEILPAVASGCPLPPWPACCWCFTGCASFGLIFHGV